MSDCIYNVAILVTNHSIRFKPIYNILNHFKNALKKSLFGKVFQIYSHNNRTSSTKYFGTNVCNLKHKITLKYAKCRYLTTIDFY